MAWTATIKQKGIQDKAFLVNISYTNGSVQFNEVVDMSGGTLQSLSDTIQSRLTSLERTQTLIGDITLGAFTPIVPTPVIPVPPVTTPLQIFQQNYLTFQSAQRAVVIGLITDTDPLYINALANMKATWDTSFLGSI